jgi:hypothetical protein
MTILLRQNSRLNQSAKDQYLLFYKHFAYLSPKEISKLYTMMILD